MLSNSPANWPELQEIERTDRAQPQPSKGYIMKPYTRRYLILQFCTKAVALKVSRSNSKPTATKIGPANQLFVH
jgi:hypothetical protein